nr:MAG TPA: hypothetical protein [Bacteriophage sp.]
MVIYSHVLSNLFLLLKYRYFYIISFSIFYLSFTHFYKTIISKSVNSRDSTFSKFSPCT